MQRSTVPLFFLGLAAVLAASALVLLIMRPGVDSDSDPEEVPSAVVESEPEPAPAPEIGDVVDPVVEPEVPMVEVDDLEKNRATTRPEALVEMIAGALQRGDVGTLEQLIGDDVLGPEQSERLKALVAAGFQLREEGGVREVGELELNSRMRWALEFDGPEPGRGRILLDLKKKDGKWSVETVLLPPAAGEPVPTARAADSLGVADAFLQAVLRQDFEFARDFVDSATVSDAKIAGLCILFEEGDYRMRESKPLRAMFQREKAAGFLANVETSKVDEKAQFTVALRQPQDAENWVVSEINLDQLLADYAHRVAGGDIYYSPLVKNPQGGDTLALYFDFDEDEMSPRTRRQLEIVSLLLRVDAGKKIRLSGHTDSMGSKSYNDNLSQGRAETVREFLISAGVDASQIVTVGKGASQPRRPNVTETGEDDPLGRRANRRTEIYLDF